MQLRLHLLCNQCNAEISKIVTKLDTICTYDKPCGMCDSPDNTSHCECAEAKDVICGYCQNAMNQEIDDLLDSFSC